ncbi:MAG: flagellar brake protein, partial [Rhodocyclaceae bacterium]|nr:flagellar brake protein [Rhodocyclaceae bacterium]
MTTQPISADELERFTTRNPREIHFYLHQLINDGERVSVNFSEGKETELTMLLDINADENMLIFD